MGQKNGLIRTATLLLALVALPLIWRTLWMTTYKWSRLWMRINRRNRKRKAANRVDFGSDKKERGTRKRLKRPWRVGLENEDGLLRYWPFFFIYLPDSLKQPISDLPTFPSLYVPWHPFLILLAPPAECSLFFQNFFPPTLITDKLPEAELCSEISALVNSFPWFPPLSNKNAHWSRPFNWSHTRFRSHRREMGAVLSHKHAIPAVRAYTVNGMCDRKSPDIFEGQSWDFNFNFDTVFIYLFSNYTCSYLGSRTSLGRWAT